MNDNGRNTHHNLILSALTVVGDVLICVLLYTLFWKASDELTTAGFRQSAVVVTGTYFICVITGGVILYKRNVRDFQVLLLVLRNILLFTVASVLLLNTGGFVMLSPLAFTAFLLSQLILASTFRLGIRQMVKAYRTYDSHKRHAVFVGSKDNIRALYDEMASVPYFGYAVMGYFDYQPNPNFPKNCPYLGTPADVEQYLRNHSEVHELFCCLSSRHEADIVPIIHYCANNLVHFFSVPNVSNYLHHRMYLNMIGDVPYLSLYREPLERLGLEIVTPCEEERRWCHELIFRELWCGSLRDPDREGMRRMLAGMAARGAQVILVACTALAPHLTHEDSPVPLWESDSLHAHEAALVGLEEVPLPE